MSNPGPSRVRGNPAAILLGNPTRAVKTKGPSSKKAPMAKKKRTAAQKRATAKMLAANRARRTGRKASKPRAARKARASKPRKARKSSRRARKSSAPIIRTVYVSKRKDKRKVKLQIRRTKRKARRSRRARGSLLRTISLNPALSIKAFIAPVTGVIGNLKSSVSSAAGIAGIAGGAVGAIAGGTLLARVTMPLAMKVAPGFAVSPMGARVLAVLNYYGAGFLLAKFLPVNDRIKRGILAGAVVAAVVEVVRPGTVQNLVSKVPVVGPIVAGNLGGIEPELGAYLDTAMNGLGMSNNDVGGSSFNLGAYELGAYESVDGLGCSPSAQELVSYED